MINELAKEVAEWHIGVFDCEAIDIARKAHQEAYELTNANGDAEVSEELADVILCCLALAGRAGLGLDKAIRDKFAINKQRAIDGRWKPLTAETGSGRVLL